MQASTLNGARLLGAVRERAIRAAGTVAGTAAEPKMGAHQLKSAVPWSRLAVAGAAFAVGFFAGRRLRRRRPGPGRDVSG